jgi:hypothetical protein
VAALKPKKLCVFCGSAPESKTREHVIPQWLIKLTGDPKRKANFHIDWKKNPPGIRQFAFDQFTFPACDTCNSNFAKLEGAAHEIVTALLAGGELAETDFHLLLDWLDKVRVPSGNINPERKFPSMFEPVHGSAPDIAGKGIANPVGQVWSAAMMLEHLGEQSAADHIMSAIEKTLLGPSELLTSDLGGNGTTATLGDAIVAAL